MRSSPVVLPERICGKVEGFGDGRTGGTAEPGPEGFDANSPGPPVDTRFCETGPSRPAGIDLLLVCRRQTNGQGFRAADAHFVGPLGRWNPIDRPSAWIASPHEKQN